jgi:hypothetical protein
LKYLISFDPAKDNLTICQREWDKKADFKTEEVDVDMFS